VSPAPAAAPARDPLTALYPEIRRRIAALAAGTWPALEEQIARHLTAVPLPTPTLLPAASAAAVGGEARRALPVAAASGLLIVALRWFDDLQDRDRDESLWQEIGPGRATNMAAAALALSWRALADDPELPPAVLAAWGDGCLDLARGQDDDLCAGTVRSLPDYLEMLRGKTGAAFGVACRAGALAGGGGAAAAGALGRFGERLGVLVQVLDDLDGTFHPDGIGDLAVGKVTLPVLYGMHADHPRRDELCELVAGGRLAPERERVREILEAIDTREYLMWAALERRREALECLAELPPPESEGETAGRATLARCADAVLAGWESLLDRDDRSSPGASAPVPAGPPPTPAPAAGQAAPPATCRGLPGGYFGGRR
jgi:geranylgeranyl diphosphate synthase type I